MKKSNDVRVGDREMFFDGAAILGLLLGIGLYMVYLSEQRNRRGRVLFERNLEDANAPEEVTVEEALFEVVMIDDFEEELEDDGYFDDEG